MAYFQQTRLANHNVVHDLIPSNFRGRVADLTTLIFDLDDTDVILEAEISEAVIEKKPTIYITLQ